MGKYDGINIAEVTLIDNRNQPAYRKKEKQNNRVGFLVKVAVAALIAVFAFIGKWTNAPATETVSDFVIKAILYDMSFSESEPGDGVLAAFFELPGGEPA